MSDEHSRDLVEHYEEDTQASHDWLAHGRRYAVAMTAAVALPGVAAHAAPARAAAADQLAASSKPAATGYVAPKETLQLGDRARMCSPCGAEAAWGLPAIG